MVREASSSSLVVGSNLTDTIIKEYAQQLQKNKIRKTVRKFWYFFLKSKNNELYEPLIDAINYLSQICDDSNSETFRKDLLTRIGTNLPKNLRVFTSTTYSTAFKIFLKQHQHQTDDDESIFNEEPVNEASDAYLLTDEVDYSCQGCNCEADKCCCAKILENFWTMNDQIKKLGLMQTFIKDIPTEVVRGFAERKISAKCKSNFSVSFLNELQAWVEGTVKKWIIDVHHIKQVDTIERIGRDLVQYLNETYANVRVSHLFDIILDYPDSEAAIQDLKRCLDQTSSQEFRIHLIETVKHSLERSLLHPGVNTLDILTAYISSIKALRALDPSGLILQLVTEPIRKYLKSRDDTVRCIVTTLTDENHSELNKEMLQSSQQGDDQTRPDLRPNVSAVIVDSDGLDIMHPKRLPKWKPDPLDLISNDEHLKHRFSDIVSILVNIYETKDRFVEEYQKLLSQRLLHKYEECAEIHETELRNLELLTARFNDCELHRCEVMLKDTQSSKRIRKRILDDEIKAHKLDFKNIDALIVSCPFWPEKFGQLATIGEEAAQIDFPDNIEDAIKTYTKAFETIKANRTLHWRHHLGLVDLDLIFGSGDTERTVNFKVTPLHASIIYLFQEKKSWKLNELLVQTSLTAATLRSRISLWIRNGIIKDSKNDYFELVEE